MKKRTIKKRKKKEVTLKKKHLFVKKRRTKKRKQIKTKKGGTPRKSSRYSSKTDEAINSYGEKNFFTQFDNGSIQSGHYVRVITQKPDPKFKHIIYEFRPFKGIQLFQYLFDKKLIDINQDRNSSSKSRKSSELSSNQKYLLQFNKEDSENTVYPLICERTHEEQSSDSSKSAKEEKLNHSFCILVDTPKEKYIKETGDTETQKIVKIMEEDLTYKQKLIEEVNQYMLPEKSEKKKEDYCNLSLFKYNIIDELEIDGETILIVGFPDPKHMFPIIAQIEQFKEQIKYNKNYKDLMIELYNQCYPVCTPEGIKSKIKEDTKYELLYTFEINRLITSMSEDKWMSTEDITKFHDGIKQLLKDNVDKIYNRLNIEVDYIFHFFKKEGDKYVALFKTIREIADKYLHLFEQTKKIIQTKILKIFDETIEESENFFSTMRLADYPVLRVKYFHANTNFSNFYHLYQSSITLENMIYSLSLKDNYFEKATFEYPIKRYRIEEAASKIQENYIVKSLSLKEMETNQENFYKNPKTFFLERKHNLNLITEEENKIEKIGKIILSGSGLNMENTKIILCNHLSNFHIEIYFMLNDKTIYYLLIKPNLCDLFNRFYENLTTEKITTKAGNEIEKKSIIINPEKVNKFVRENSKSEDGKLKNVFYGYRENEKNICENERFLSHTYKDYVYEVVELEKIAENRERHYKNLFKSGMNNVYQSYSNIFDSLIEKTLINGKPLKEKIRFQYGKYTYALLVNGILYYCYKTKYTKDLETDSQYSELYNKHNFEVNKNIFHVHLCETYNLLHVFEFDVNEFKPLIWYFRLDEDDFQVIKDYSENHNNKEKLFKVLERLKDKNRFRSLFDIKSDEELKSMLEEIEKESKRKESILFSKEFYNKKTHGIYCNNIIDFDMSSFHIHLLPYQFYQLPTLIKYNTNITHSIRLISIYEVLYNLSFNKEYYRNKVESKHAFFIGYSYKIGSNIHTS